MKYLIRELYYSLIGGVYLLKSKHLKLHFRAKISLGSNLEGYNKLSHHSYLSGELGYASYIGEHSIVCGKVGRFCSIAGNVRFLTLTHPVKTFVSSHPCFYSTKKQSGFSFVTEQKFEEQPKKVDRRHSITVGNDVYIGNGATIIGPVDIGDGAVIAANATVTADVPAYTIVGGTPARIIKKRFSDDEIDFLLKLQWWNKDAEWLRKNADKFENIEYLMSSVESLD